MSCICSRSGGVGCKMQTCAVQQHERACQQSWRSTNVCVCVRVRARAHLHLSPGPGRLRCVWSPGCWASDIWWSRTPERNARLLPGSSSASVSWCPQTLVQSCTSEETRVRVAVRHFVWTIWRHRLNTVSCYTRCSSQGRRGCANSGYSAGSLKRPRLSPRSPAIICCLVN